MDNKPVATSIDTIPVDEYAERILSDIDRYCKTAPIPKSESLPWWEILHEESVNLPLTSTSEFHSIVRNCLYLQSTKDKLTAILIEYWSVALKTPIGKWQEFFDTSALKTIPGLFKISCNLNEVTYTWSHGVIVIRKNHSDFDFLCTCTNPEHVLIIKEVFSLFQRDVKPEGKVFVLLPNACGGLDTEAIGIGGSSLVEENYRPEVITGYKKIIADLNSKKPLGRLTIIDGPPGTGKTYLVRAILNDCPDVKFLVLPSNMVSTMTGPQLLAALLKATDNKAVSLGLVVEDADECLSARNAGNMSAISNILNLSDGIIGNLLDLHIICTANTEIENFDEAVLRNGRLSVRLEVGKLDAKQAEAVYKRIGGKDSVIKWNPENFYPLSDIYALANGKEDVLSIVNGQNRQKIGFSK